MKTRRTLKEKLLAVLLALAMLLPAVPNLGMVDIAEAASAYTLHEANASGGDGDAYRFKSGKFMQLYVVRYNSGMDPKEQTASYHAEATDTCDFGHESKPWSALLYTIKYQISKHMRDDAKKSKLL